MGPGVRSAAGYVPQSDARIVQQFFVLEFQNACLFEGLLEPDDEAVEAEIDARLGRGNGCGAALLGHRNGTDPSAPRCRDVDKSPVPVRRASTGLKGSSGAVKVHSSLAESALEGRDLLDGSLESTLNCQADRPTHIWRQRTLGRGGLAVSKRLQQVSHQLKPLLLG